MLILTHDTLRNPSILEVRQLPRKFFGRVTPRPKGKLGLGLRLRMLVEFQVLRYAVTLLPLVVVIFVWQGTALHISQSPLLMLAILWFVEMRVLRVPDSKRAGLIDLAEAERGLDMLQVQARAALTRITAQRGLRRGQLHLVVEQSELGGFAPLTYVTVQSDEGPHVVSLTAEERSIIEETLFQEPLTERFLHRINQSQDIFIRDVALEARAVSAHARLAGVLG